VINICTDFILIQPVVFF